MLPNDVRRAWADRCGLAWDESDDRVREPEKYGWPHDFEIFYAGWKASYTTAQELVPESSGLPWTGDVQGRRPASCAPSESKGWKAELGQPSDKRTLEVDRELVERVVMLLQTYAEHGMDAVYANGERTPNAKLADDTAAAFSTLLAMTPVSESAPPTVLSNFAQWWSEQDKNAFQGASYKSLDEEIGAVHSWCKAAWLAASSSASAIQATTGEPMAWAVFQPKGHEFDYLVFFSHGDAEAHLADRQDVEEDDWHAEIIPLYRRSDSEAVNK